MIAIIDYGMGNLKSVSNALKFLNIDSIITSDIDKIKNADAIILPGVGAFKDAMINLKSKGLDEIIKEEVSLGKPLLGICLGMQMLFSKSYEVCETLGLNLIDGEIRKIELKEKAKIPHIGWSRLDKNREDELLKDLSLDEYVYYVHSFMACDYNDCDLVGYSNYGGVKIPGIFRKGNVIGIQFHPEKSGETGLKILKNFGEMIV